MNESRPRNTCASTQSQTLLTQLELRGIPWVILLGEARGPRLFLYPGTLTGAALFGEDL
jgi:hypothetical protein